MGVVRGFFALFAFGLVSVGLLGLLGSVGLYFDEEQKYSLVESVIMFLVIGVFPLAMGFALALFIYRSVRDARHEEEERLIFDLASSKGGTISLAEVSAFTELSSRQAERILENLHRRGIAEMRVAEGGAMVYRFPGFLSDSQKSASEGYGD